MGLVTVGFVLLITVYLVISGIPAISEIGFFEFVFGKTWMSTHESNPQFGILPFILTSIYRTAGAVATDVPKNDIFLKMRIKNIADFSHSGVD